MSFVKLIAEVLVVKQNFSSCFNKSLHGSACKMAQGVKVLAAKSDDPSSIPGIDKTEAEN